MRRKFIGVRPFESGVEGIGILGPASRGWDMEIPAGWRVVSITPMVGERSLALVLLEEIDPQGGVYR